MSKKDNVLNLDFQELDNENVRVGCGPTLVVTSVIGTGKNVNGYYFKVYDKNDPTVYCRVLIDDAKVIGMEDEKLVLTRDKVNEMMAILDGNYPMRDQYAIDLMPNCRDGWHGLLLSINFLIIDLPWFRSVSVRKRMPNYLKLAEGVA